MSARGQPLTPAERRRDFDVRRARLAREHAADMAARESVEAESERRVQAHARRLEELRATRNHWRREFVPYGGGA